MGVCVCVLWCVCVCVQRLLVGHQQQQLPVGASTHAQTREALAVRSLIAECIQLVKLLRALCQWRVSPAMQSLDQAAHRDTEAQMMTAIRQVCKASVSCLSVCQWKVSPATQSLN